VLSDRVKLEQELKALDLQQQQLEARLSATAGSRRSRRTPSPRKKS
jgi:hypothetical protein